VLIVSGYENPRLGGELAVGHDNGLAEGAFADGRWTSGCSDLVCPYPICVLQGGESCRPGSLGLWGNGDGVLWLVPRSSIWVAALDKSGGPSTVIKGDLFEPGGHPVDGVPLAVCHDGLCEAIGIPDLDSGKNAGSVARERRVVVLGRYCKYVAFIDKRDAVAVRDSEIVPSTDFEAVDVERERVVDRDQDVRRDGNPSVGRSEVSAERGVSRRIGYSVSCTTWGPDPIRSCEVEAGDTGRAGCNQEVKKSWRGWSARED